MSNESPLESPATAPAARGSAPRRRPPSITIAVIATLVGVSAAAVAFKIPWGAPGPAAERFAYRSDARLPELWPVPAFSFQDQHASPLEARDLFGRVWIADFIFTTCTNVCPMLSAQMTLLMRDLPDAELRFVSFSVDPAHDTPDVLRAYHERWQPDESRWSLLATDPSGLSTLASGMRVTVEATKDTDNPILHTSSFFLVDARGQVRGVYTASDPQALERLAADARSLRGSAARRDGGPAEGGAALYARLGCAGCHADPRLAPSLHGLAGSEVRLEGGGSRRADAVYLRDALVSPGHELTAGYLNIMPAYGASLSSDALDALVAYVLSLGGGAAPDTTSTVESSAAPITPAASAAPIPPASPRPPPATIATDPVCQMQVRVTPETPHATADGSEHYFCSEHCRGQFLASHEQHQR